MSSSGLYTHAWIDIPIRVSDTHTRTLNTYNTYTTIIKLQSTPNVI